MMLSNTIVALSTANASSAIAMLRLSGEEAVEIASTVFSPISQTALTLLSGYSACYGSFVLSNGEKLDDGVALVYRSPKSYTGENMVELCCHGNPLIAQKLLSACVEAGARPAAAGEFTKRAFLNGKLDLAQAEAVAELIAAESESAIRQARFRREGSLSLKIERISDALLSLQAALGVWSDYPEETDIPFMSTEQLQEQLLPVRAELQALLVGCRSGALIQRGISVAVVGSPNVGKSTLANLLWGEDRSIVTDVAGTTRDVVEAALTLEGITVRLLDTAGIRETSDRVEQLGVSRSWDALAVADLVLLVLDSSQHPTSEDLELAAQLYGRPHLLVKNKTDLPSVPFPKAFDHALPFSAAKGEGAEALKTAMLAQLGLNLSQDSALIASSRQQHCVKLALQAVEQALEALAAQMTLDAVGIWLDEALAALLELSGKQVNEAVCDEIFANFCVGK